MIDIVKKVIKNLVNQKLKLAVDLIYLTTINIIVVITTLTVI